jgi:hypothetical protein
MKTPFAAVAALLLVPVPSATAASVPAYGTIVIRDDGLGARATTTYELPTWRCRTSSGESPTLPSWVRVECFPRETIAFACPLMVLTVRTLGTGRAGGKVTCTSTVDLGIVSGTDLRSTAAALGPVPSIRCDAYGGDLPLVPPYEVTCAEPGLPGYYSRGSEE